MTYQLNFASPTKPTATIEVPEVTMELEPVPKQEFMARFNRYEPKIKDSTAVRSFKTCDRKYFLEIVLGFTSNTGNIVFAWGISYHKYREVLEREYGFGPNKPPQFDLPRADAAHTTARQIALKYWIAHSDEQPEGSKWEFMSTGRLIQTFETAYEYWKIEKQRGQIEVIAIEQPFNVQLADGSYRAGRADQLVRWNGALWGRDFKTTSKDSDFFARSIDPNDQFTGYILGESLLAGEPVQGQIVELMYNVKIPKRTTPSKNYGPVVIPLTVAKTEQQLKQWERELVVVHKQIDMDRELDIWPMKEISCPFCTFHSVCIKPTESSMMAALEQNFTQRAWDCTKIGEVE
jgi:PD-(D/E)XK nuclease superfamily